MLRLLGKVKKVLEGGISMTSTLDVSVNLSSRGLITTKSMKPYLCIGDVVYTRECNCKMGRINTQSVVLQRANDFDGYRISFFRSQFATVLDAYKMCLDLLIRELGYDAETAMFSMPSDLINSHGAKFADGLHESILDSIFEPFNEGVSEFEIYAELGVFDRVKERIRQVVNIDAE